MWGGGRRVNYTSYYSSFSETSSTQLKQCVLERKRGGIPATYGQNCSSKNAVSRKPARSFFITITLTVYFFHLSLRTKTATGHVLFLSYCLLKKIMLPFRSFFPLRIERVFNSQRSPHAIAKKRKVVVEAKFNLIIKYNDFQILCSVDNSQVIEGFFWVLEFRIVSNGHTRNKTYLPGLSLLVPHHLSMP